MPLKGAHDTITQVTKGLIYHEANYMYIYLFIYFLSPKIYPGNCLSCLVGSAGHASGICGLAHTRFADVHTSTSGICGLAHTRFADLHIRDLRTCTYAICVRTCTLRDLRTCEHVVDTWQPRGNNCTSANRVCASPQIPDVHVCTSPNCVCASPQIPDVHVCTSANCVCASPQIPDVHVCTSANRVCASPQIPDVHVCTSANRVCARHDSRDLPGHRNENKCHETISGTVTWSSN